MLKDQAKKKFPFTKDDVVLAQYGNEFYYAKILSINHNKKFANLIFDDDSKEKVNFKKIFSGKLMIRCSYIFQVFATLFNNTTVLKIVVL